MESSEEEDQDESGSEYIDEAEGSDVVEVDTDGTDDGHEECAPGRLCKDCAPRGERT